MDNSLNQLTYEKMKRDILSFELKPGETVSAAKVAERYLVSRTPARETLVKLETEGLVEIIPQSKTVISKIDLSKAKQEWFIRYSLETAMTDDLFKNLKKSDIAELKKNNQEMIKLCHGKLDNENSYLYMLYDNAFHAVIYRVARQELAANVISNTMAHYSRLRFLTDHDDYYIKRTVSGHAELIELLENNDLAGYKKSIETHLQHILNDIPDMEKLYPDYFA